MTPGHSGASQPFQDILDGYFTLRDSVRQMADRHAFAWATLTLMQAPVMDVPGLSRGEPVPLHLREGHAGLIETLVLTAVRVEGGDMRLFGVGEWRWFDDRAGTALPADVRLGEPAFVRGFGWPAASGSGAAPARDALTDLQSALARFQHFRAFLA